MEFLFSHHARQRMLERGINEETVKDIILRPDFVRASFGGRKIATKRLERDWHAVFREEEGKIAVISIYSE